MNDFFLEFDTCRCIWRPVCGSSLACGPPIIDDALICMEQAISPYSGFAWCQCLWNQPVLQFVVWPSPKLTIHIASWSLTLSLVA